MTTIAPEPTRVHNNNTKSDFHLDKPQSDNGTTHRKHLTDVHLNCLLDRGLTHVTIEAAGLWSASVEEVAQILGYDPKSAGIVIPYLHPITGQVILNRVRPDRPPIIDKKPAKYLSPQKRIARNHLYFPPGAKEWIHDPSVPIGFTEGEFKTLWAYQVGLKHIGFIGVWGWRGRA